MEIITIIKKEELLACREEIEILFRECFGGRDIEKIWDWAYIENPNGDPLVSLCYDEGVLVGHYAAIPMPIRNSSGRLNSYLSMTTMVAASHRQYGLFVKLAENTYKYAIDMGVDFVMGFPNSMSTPGFKKRLNWVLPSSDFVASVSKSQLLMLSTYRFVTDEMGGYRFDLEDEASRNWRLSRPGARYHWDNGLAYKEFDEGIDLLSFKTRDDLERLPDNVWINLLVPAEAKQFMPFKVFDYQFGGISLKSRFDPERVVRLMALSDVF